MDLFFNTEMNTNVNISHFSDYPGERRLREVKELIHMHLLPHDNWQNEIKDFNMSNLNFTWNVTSFRKNVLKVQLNFNSPINISP
jgi:hypothetical protein